MYLSLFIANMRPATLLKRRPWHRCFPVNFEKFLRTPFFTEHLWWLLLDRVMNTLLRSSRPYMLFKINVLKNFAIFTGKHKCWSLFLLKQACKSRNFIKMRLQHWCFFVNVCRILKNRFFYGRTRLHLTSAYWGFCRLGILVLSVTQSNERRNEQQNIKALCVLLL